MLSSGDGIVRGSVGGACINDFTFFFNANPLTSGKFMGGKVDLWGSTLFLLCSLTNEWKCGKKAE